MILSQFVEIFTEMGWISGVLLSLGILFCVIEMFIPGVGFFGISGAILVVAGIVVRALKGASLSQILIMIILFVGVVLLLFLLMVLCAKNGLFNKTAIIEGGTAISKSYFKKIKEKESLIGKKGTAKTELNLGGLITIDGKDFEARTLEVLIPQGCDVQVCKIEDNEIIVKRII